MEAVLGMVWIFSGIAHFIQGGNVTLTMVTAMRASQKQQLEQVNNNFAMLHTCQNIYYFFTTTKNSCELLKLETVLSNLTLRKIPKPDLTNFKRWNYSGEVLNSKNSVLFK